MVRTTTLVALSALLLNATTVLGAVASKNLPIQRAEGLRLIKTSDDDAGTWMTEEEKFEKLISKHIGFMDITETSV